MELIDEMKGQLPIPAYASQDLSRYLVRNGKDIKPDTELKIIQVVDSGNGAVSPVCSKWWVLIPL